MQSSRAILVYDPSQHFVGPIFKSIFQYANEQGIDIVGPNYDLSQYDSIIAAVNRPEKMEGMKTNASVGWWMLDLRVPYEMQGLPDSVSHIFLCNTELIENYERAYDRPVYHMPQCGIEEPMVKGRKIDWDVIFIGNIASSRFHHGRLDVITGITNGGEYKTKFISGEKFTKDTKWLYYQTPFSLSMSPRARGYTSNRTYNILSSGGFCLILWYPEIEKQFKNHEHVAWFQTPEEAREIISYYLDNEEEYYRIRENGERLYWEKHSASCRLEEMFAILEGNKQEPSFYLDYEKETESTHHR